MNDIINKINDILIETENFNSTFLPIQDVLNPIKNDINDALNKLKNLINQSTNTSDKIHFINRYVDLIKKVESIFEAKDKRLLQILQTVNKLPNIEQQNIQDNDETTNNLTPEQCNEILKIINKEG